MAQITYENKVKIDDSSLPAINKVRDVDMNEIKNVVNENETDFINSLPVILYNDSNGTTDNITLSGTTDNYNNIEISYKYQTNYGKTIKVNIEVNKSFTLHDTYILNNKIIEIFGAFTCSGNRINKIQGEFGYTENGNIHIDGQNYFSITKVLGYK